MEESCDVDYVDDLVRLYESKDLAEGLLKGLGRDVALINMFLEPSKC